MNRQIGPQIEIARASFTDIDQFAEWSIGRGWETAPTQFSPGSNDVQFDHIAFEGLSVAHFCSTQALHYVFAVPKGMVVFLICREKLPVVLSGRNFPPTLMNIVRAGRENWCVLPAGLDCYEFMVSEELIRRTELFPPQFFARTAQLEHAYMPLAEPVTGLFLTRMDAVFLRRRGTSTPAERAIHATRFFDLVVDGLQQCFEAGLAVQGLQGPRATRRPDLVTKGRDFVSAHLDADFSLDDMARALGVSYRVLNYAFKDSLGVSPYQYALEQRLHAVRRSLKTSDASVTEASQLYGFSHPSRFAFQYQRLFGELPSETRHQNGG